MVSVLIRDRRGDTDTQRVSSWKTTADIGVMQPQAKEHLETPEAERDKYVYPVNKPTSGSWEGFGPLPQLSL